MAGGMARGDVRLYEFAPPDKRRPVVVLTRDSAIPYLTSVTVAPITSTIRGVPSEVLLGEEDGMKTACAVNLHNAVTVAQARIGKRDRPAELGADGRNLHRPAVLARVYPRLRVSGCRATFGVMQAAPAGCRRRS